jgi:hypothetical protein
MNDVAGQTTQAKREFATEKEKCTNEEQYRSED